ncbi:hypothetical protein [Bradyrhizobium sp. 144]|uniref:hypothetical protein n=1 Tax=Bradyrhizobium sp. 144 TaxID=2782620 RepID=UPI001FF9CAA7|nr:hypothetical protein [Bradyrhizobium sp. 144]MCK1693841.1 hypothetical protein [Bradyrhizobium sp. 144]
MTANASCAESFDTQVSVSGFSQEDGTKLANLIADVIKNVCSEGIDLSALEGVTVTPNYQEALAQFNSGLPTPRTPTVEEFANGRAMAVRCKRGDRFKSHLFLDTDIVSPLLLGETDPGWKLASNVLIHELVHVYDADRIGRDLANEPFTNDLTGWLFLITNATWSEYYACLLTAETDPSLDDYVTIFLSAVEQYPRAIREQIIAYRSHADIQLLMDFVKDKVASLFKFAGYVLGNLDGTGRQLELTHPSAWQTIQDADFSDFWLELQAALREMNSQPWRDISIYDALGRVAIRYLNSEGMFPRDESQGLYVEIPAR